MKAGQWLKSVCLVQGSGQLSGAVLHSSREPGVRRPCSDFMDMLRRIISRRIIIVIINQTAQFGHVHLCKFLGRNFVVQVSCACVIVISLLQKRSVTNELRLSVRSIEREIGNITMPTGFDSYPDFLAVALLLLITLLVSVGVKVICLVYLLRIMNSVNCYIKIKIPHISFLVTSP